MVKLSTGFPKVEITEVNQSKPSWSRVKLIDGVLGDSEGCFVPQEMVLYVGVPPKDNPNLDSDDESEESSYDGDGTCDGNEDANEAYENYDAKAHAKVKTNPTTTTTKTDTSFITPAPASTQKGVIDVSSNPFSKRLSEVTHVMKLKARECPSPRQLLPSPTSDGSDGSDSSDDNNKKKKARPSGTTPNSSPDRPANVPRCIIDKTAPFPVLLARLLTHASPNLAMVLLFCFAELVFNMALPKAVIVLDGSVKTPLIKKQWTLLDGFFSVFAYFYGVEKIGASVQAKENQQIRMLAHNNCSAYKRALHFMKLI